jgi:hypothetical protein
MKTSPHRNLNPAPDLRHTYFEANKHILASLTLEPHVRDIELEGENIFPVCDVLLFRIY